MSSKGQVTVPRELRERLGLHAGTRVQVSIDDQGRLVLFPARHEPEELFRDRPLVERTLSVEEMDLAISRAIRDRV